MGPQAPHSNGAQNVMTPAVQPRGTYSSNTLVISYYPKDDCKDASQIAPESISEDLIPNISWWSVLPYPLQNAHRAHNFSPTDVCPPVSSSSSLCARSAWQCTSVQCEKCGEKEDILQRARKPDKVQCEKCGEGEGERVLSQLHKVRVTAPN